MDTKTKRLINEVREVKGNKLPCTCTHEFQDKLYGKGIRVHNQTKVGQFRCTVCSKIR